MKKVVWLVVLFIVFQTDDVAAQCAMCRSTLENNFSNGNPGIASAINTGILYLLVMPYLAVTLIAYFWYKQSSNARKELSGRGA